MSSPTLSPVPYLCCDPGSFAEHTLRVRLPEIARRMIAENDFPADVRLRLDALLTEMPDQPVATIDDPGAPDGTAWQRDFAPWEGLAWRNLSFLAAEEYFYRRILVATGYFQPGPGAGLDPYRKQKRLGLETSRRATRRMAEQYVRWQVQPLTPETLQAALGSNLWANRADLSIWPADDAGTPTADQLEQANEFLLADDSAAAAEHVLRLRGSGQPIQWLVDNAGFELINDLALADLLLVQGLAGQLVMQVKAHPTYVSDALAQDVDDSIAFLAAGADPNVCALGERLTEHRRRGRLLLASHFFWNAPLPMWAMPLALQRELASAGLVLSKGDANYRRLVGDLRWAAETRFPEITAYWPAALLALRVAKSEVMVGLTPGRRAVLDAREPDWRTNGRWGMIQFKVL